MAGAILFFRKVSSELLSVSVIVCKSEINTEVSIFMIFLGYSRGFGLLVDALRSKLGWIRWSIKNLVLCFNSLIYELMAIDNCFIFDVQIRKCLVVLGL